MILSSFGNEPVNKIRHFVLGILLGLLWDTSVINQLIKYATLCQLIHFLHQGDIWLFAIDLSRHYVSDTILRYFCGQNIMEH